jgi:capsular polysaccharide biosynthesis protein
MEINDFLRLVFAKKQTIFSVVFLFVILAILLTVIQPLRYSTESKLLIVQEYPRGTDPYVISKSNQTLSNVLAEVVSSNTFFHEVMNSGFGIDKGYFKSEPKKQVEEWRRTVSARTFGDAGILVVNIYHTDRQQSEQIAMAVNQTMKAKHGLFHGNPENVNIKVIDQPLSSDWPVRPNIFMNLIAGFSFGLVFALVYIYVLPQGAYDLRVIPATKKGTGTAMAHENHTADETAVEYEEDLDRAKREYLRMHSKLQHESHSVEYSGERDYSKGDIKNVFG